MKRLMRVIALTLLAALISAIAPSDLWANNQLDTSKLPGILLDDQEAKKTGTWHDSTHFKPYVGQGYIHSGQTSDPTSKESKSVLFETELPASGYYSVYLSYNSTSSRAAAVPISIKHIDGIEEIRLDQRKEPEGPASFHLLGEFSFSADQKLEVTIGNESAKGIVIIDALLIVSKEEQEQLAKFKPVAIAANAVKKPAVKKKPASVLEKAPAFVRAELSESDQVSFTSNQLDQLIEKEARVEKTTDLIDDEQFLRRATLDVIGRLPSEEETMQFAQDDSPDKRSKLIDRLLDSPNYGTNWANYWSDVFSYRIPQPQLTFLNYDTPKQWIAEELNAGQGWDAIAYQILTGSGKVADEPAAFFVGFHQADTSRLASETTRVFLGTQIECAECHDHPFVDIPQERFHQMAAFFVRTKAELPWNDSNQIEVSSKTSGEHKMPESGKEMMPAVFEGDELAKGISDIDRRTNLSRWITARDNKMFAKAFVNRVWDRLMDEALCDPIDDISDESGYSSFPELHNAVGDYFISVDYDAKALIRLMMNTKTYQRDLNRDGAALGLLSAATPKKLRGDEIFDSLAVSIQLQNVKGEPGKASETVRFPPPPKSTRDLINEAFGYDPSLGKDFRPQTMQQAMYLMNNKQLQAEVNAKKDSETKLAEILKNSKDDNQAIERLFVNILARQPTESDMRISLDFIASTENRNEAFEDLLWSLLNSAEFTTRR